MEIKTMEYLRRKNIGNYEHEELKVSGVLEDGESSLEGFESLKYFVLKCLDIKEEDRNQLALPIKQIEEKAVKSVKKHEEVVSDNNKLEEKIEDKAEKKKGAKKASKPETVPAKKPIKETSYDRSLNTHKNLLGLFLDKSYPKWREAESLNKAIEASKSLNGKPFLDEAGEILPSFKESFSQFMEQ